MANSMRDCTDCSPGGLRVALVIEAAGIPTTLASTAFIGSVAEGFERIGVSARVVGLLKATSMWVPAALGDVEHSAPWLAAGAPLLTDRLQAARSGVLDDGIDTHTAYVAGDWYDELLLERELTALGSPADPGVLLVYPRSYSLLRIAIRVARRLGWKVLAFATEALSDQQIDPSARERYVECVVGHCDGVWAVSEHLAGFWRARGVPTERILVQPTVTRAASFEPGGEQPDRHSAAYVGNLAHREIDYLLDIAEIVHRDIDDFRLTIYGDAHPGRRAELQAILRDRRLADVVRIELPVLPVEVPRVTAIAGALLLPRARGEFSEAGFPNKVGEYLATGRPVLTTRVGDIPRYLIDGDTAVLVDPDDCRVFAAALVWMMTDVAAAEAIGARGRDLAMRLWSSDVVARRVREFVEGLPASSVPPAERSHPALRMVRIAGTYSLTLRRRLGSLVCRMRAFGPGRDSL